MDGVHGGTCVYGRLLEVREGARVLDLGSGKGGRYAATLPRGAIWRIRRKSFAILANTRTGDRVARELNELAGA